MTPNMAKVLLDCVFVELSKLMARLILYFDVKKFFGPYTVVLIFSNFF